MADVAKRAGVHVTTVSLALRNNPRLCDATRRRLVGLAAKLGYRPDPMLQALVAYRSLRVKPRNSPTLAYVTNWRERFGWKHVTAHPDFFAGATDKAKQLGFKLDHFWLREPGLTQDRFGQMLFARGIRGLIVASHGRRMGDELQLDWGQFSAVKIDYFPHSPVLNNVTNNQRDIIRMAMQRVVAAGYHRIGFVMHGGWDQAADRLWSAGFECEQQHRSVADRVPAYIIQDLEPSALDGDREDNPTGVDVPGFKRWLRTHRPEVIISKGSFVLPQMRELGLRIPDDIAFVDVFLERTDGVTAGVRQNHRKVGSVATEILVRQLQHNFVGIPAIPTTTFVDGDWFDGRSLPSLEASIPGSFPAARPAGGEPASAAFRVTLKDVGLKAGVHFTTVSRSLQDDPRIPAETRIRLRNIARRMGYISSPFMRALVPYRGAGAPQLKVPTIAYFTNWLTRWGWKDVPAHFGFFRGAKAKANELGFQLKHFWLHEPGLTQERLSRILADQGINGVIIASYSREMSDQLQLDWENLGAVKIDYFPHWPPLDNVTNNQCSIIRLAMRKTTAAGYRRLGFVVHRGWDHAVDNNWTAGFLSEQQVMDLPLPAHVFPALQPVGRWLHETNPSVQADLKPFEDWLDKYQPEILISKGAYVLPLLKKMGISIPRDIAFADLFLNQFDGSTAGVRQNHDEVGAKAVEILSGQLQQNKFGIPAVPTKTYVNGNWFDGASCPVLIRTELEVAEQRSS
jgi:LacI family transcriptional regulator